MPQGLTFNEDTGEAYARWGDHDVTLRPVTLGEYRSFLLEQQEAQTFLEAAITEDTTTGDDGEPVVTRRLRDLDVMGTNDEPGPYVKLWVRVLAELGDETVAPSDVAVWMGLAPAFGELVSHWRSDPLAPGVTPTS